MMQKFTKQALCWLVLTGLAFFTLGCSQEPKVLSYVGSTMGTTYHIKAVFPASNQPDSITLQQQTDTFCWIG